MSGYLKHFRLRAAPFRTTPDPAFAYGTREHELAVAKIQYSVEERQGIFLLQGDVGLGKTTLANLMVSGWQDDPTIALAHLVNPSVRTPAAFLRLVLAQYGIDPPIRTQNCWQLLREMLVENYRKEMNTVLVIDEAQALSGDNMDTLMHMSNEQTPKAKLIQIVLFSQPTMLRKLSYKPALKDRIAHGSVLNPLTFEDAHAMLQHRVEIAGGDYDALFPGDLTRRIFNSTGGRPRRLCMLCDNALVNAYAHRRPAVAEEDLDAALTDLAFKGWEKGEPTI